MKKHILIIMIICFMACSCQNNQIKDEPASTTIVVGYSQLGDESSWRTFLSSSIKKAAAESGLQLVFVDAEQKQENQIKAIRSFISYQVDIIAFSPIVETGWDNVLTEAKLAGIPVILVDRKITTKDSSLYKCYIGSDFEREGYEAALYLLKKYKWTKEEVNIVELCGTTDSSPAIGRSKGFREGLKDYPNFKIIYSESADFMRSKGKEMTTSIISNYGKIDVLYAHNDSMALGSIDAMEKLGLNPGKDVVIITVDAEQAAIDALKEGKINCAVECNPNLGKTIMDAVKDIIANNPVEQNIYTEETIFTEWDNFDDITPRGY